MKENDVNKVLTKCNSILIVILKVLTIILTVPLIIALLGCTAVFIIGIVLIVKGVIYIGFTLGAVFCVLSLLFIIYLISKFLFNKKFKAKQIITITLILILGLGISSGIALYEISITKYIDKIPNNIETDIYEEELSYQDNLILDEDLYKINYVVDDSLTDKIKIEITYYKDYASYSINTNFNNNYNKIKIRENSDYYLINYLNLIIDNLKDKNFYNYEKLYEPTINIYTSKQNIEVIKYNNYNSIDNKDY